MSAILRILTNEYGTGADGPVEAVAWAAETVRDDAGVAAAKEQLGEINRLRGLHGLVPVTFPYGHELF